MKLLFVSNLFPDETHPYRGLDNATVLHALAERGHEVRVLALRPVLPWNRQEWSARSEDEGFAPRYVKVGYVPKFGGWFNRPLMVRRLRPILRGLRSEFEWDAVLASWLFPDGCAVAEVLESDAPGPVLIAQGSDVHHYLKATLRRSQILQACERSRAVITRSGSLARDLAAEGVDPAKLDAVHNGVDTEVFRPADVTETRRALGIAPAGKWMLFVGNLLPVKDPEFLLRAFSVLRARLEEPVRLALIGKGPMRSLLERMAGDLGLADDVRFLGPQPAGEVARWMQASDLLTMTSVNEGLPNVILEAQACGLRVLSTDVGGIREVVDQPWKGQTVPRGQLEDWVNAGVTLLGESADRARLARLGQSRSWENTAIQYEQVLNPAAVDARSSLPDNHD